MRVEIKDTTLLKEELHFPKLMISIDEDKCIVLFSETKIGVRIDKLHYFFDNWDMDYFTDFEGEITLKNK